MTQAAAATAAGSSSNLIDSSAPLVVGSVDCKNDIKKQQQRRGRWGISRGKNVSVDSGSNNIEDSNGKDTVIEYRRNGGPTVSASSIALDCGMPTTAMPDIPDIPDVVAPPLVSKTSTATISSSVQIKNQNNYKQHFSSGGSSKGSGDAGVVVGGVGGGGGCRSLTGERSVGANSRQNHLISPERPRNRSVVVTAIHHPQKLHLPHSEDHQPQEYVSPAPLMNHPHHHGNNPGNNTGSNDNVEVIDNGRHNSRDFENMIIECDDASASSFGDITYDGSIVEEEYYKNRYANQQRSMARNATSSNNNNSATAMRGDKRSVVVNGGYNYNHKTTSTSSRHPDHNHIPPRSPSSKLKPSLRQRMAQTTISNNNHNVNNNVDDQLYEQEMALIELAMERSLKDSSSATSSKFSRATYRTHTSTGSSNSGLEGSGCHLQMIASNSGKGGLQQPRAGQIVQTESGARFLWKREGKKWLKVPLGSSKNIPGSGTDESNLDAIVEEKEPSFGLSRSSSYHSNIDVMSKPLAPRSLNRSRSATYDNNGQMRQTPFSAANSSERGSPNDYRGEYLHGDINVIHPDAPSVAQLDHDQLLRMEQELIDEALLRSIECMHNSSSQASTAVSSINMASPFRSPRYVAPGGLMSSVGGVYQQSPVAMDGSSSIDHSNNTRGIRQPPSRSNSSGSCGKIGPPLIGSNVMRDQEYIADERDTINMAMEHSFHSQSSGTSYDSNRSGRSARSGRSGAASLHKNDHHYSNGGGTVSSGGGQGGSSSSRPPRPQYVRRNGGESNGLASAGCHLAMIGGRKPSTRAILNGIDYEEDEEELMAEHLQPIDNVSNPQRRPSLASRNSTMSEHRAGDSAGYSQTGVRLVWKRGPNNRWGKFPEMEESDDVFIDIDIDAEEERLVQEALARSLIE